MHLNNYIAINIIFWFGAFTIVSCARQTNRVSDEFKRERLFTGDFSKTLDTMYWVVESVPGSNTKIVCMDDKMIIDSNEGITVWLRMALKENIEIRYKRKVVLDSGVNDRLSDMNQFWMAEDPKSGNLFTRSGRFEQYDSLKLYYVGMGGNTNTTTRFRKYHGDGNKPVLSEFLDNRHLLRPNHAYAIRIQVIDGVTSFWVDDECYFTYPDAEPLRAGYFGFRLVHSRQEISDFAVDKLR